MWNFRHNDRVACGKRTGTVTRQMLHDHYVYVEWDDDLGLDEGIWDEDLTASDVPHPPRPPQEP